MLKRHSKLVVLLVMVTFLFSFIGAAGAASFPDVTGSDAEAGAIYKLNALGIIEGYPDGTFGPEKTITRAEFAKIAVYTAGLQNVATGMSASPSTFSDVKTTDWFNGWVNVAASQGFVKGYPNGTFLPNATINQAEAVTVLLRILGYNDNLAGNWPSDYIGKAANLGILDDVQFNAYGAATRGTISIFAAEALDQKVVTYVASDNYFSEGTNTLLVTKFKDWSNVAEKKLVTAVSLADGKIRFTFDDMTKAPGDAARSVTKEVASNAVFANASFWGDAAFRYVDYILNDDGDVAYVKVRSYDVVKSIDLSKTEVKTVNSEIKVDGKVYKIAANFGDSNSDSAELGTNYLAQAVGTKFDAFLATNVATLNLKADGADLVLNGDGEVGFIRLFSYPSVKPTAGALANTFNAAGVVESTTAKSGKVVLENAGSFTLDPDEPEDFYITKNGAPATFADIKAGDFIYSMNKFGTTFVVAIDAKATGTLTSYEENDATYVKKVTVDDKTYSVAVGTTSPTYSKTAWFSTDGGDSFDVLENSDADEMLDEEVTLYLNPVGKVAAIVAGGTGDAGKIYGVVNSTGQTLYGGQIQESFEILKADGTLTSYTYDEDSAINGGIDGSFNAADIYDATSGTGIVEPGVFVEVTLTSDGVVNDIKTDANITNADQDTVTALDGDSDNETVILTIGGDDYTYDASKVVVFDINLLATPGEDAEVVTAADFIDFAESTPVSPGDFAATVTYKSKDGVLQYVVIDSVSGIGGQGNLAMVAGVGTDKDGKYARFLQQDGTTKKVYLDSSDSTSKGSLIYYDLSNDEADITAWGSGATTTWDATGATLVVSKVSGNIITFEGGAQYAVDKDTLYFDYTDDDPVAAEKADIAAGDNVKVYKNTGKAIGAIVVVD